MTNYKAVAIAEGFEPAESEEQAIEAWQHLIDTGLAWTLQGWFGRNAQSLIEQGVCTAQNRRSPNTANVGTSDFGRQAGKWVKWIKQEQKCEIVFGIHLLNILDIIVTDQHIAKMQKVQLDIYAKLLKNILENNI